MIKDKKYIRLLINKTLFSKYGDSKEELNKQYIYSLLKDKKCHYSSLFKDYLIYDYIDEFLKKNYLLDELKAKLPQISIYYYHYLNFFCRPFFKHFYYNNTIQNCFDNKAEIFYKETYEIKNNKKKTKEDKGMIIFDQKTRKLLENTIVQNTLDVNSKINEINTIKENDNNKDEEFFTIKTQNDILLDILSNLSTQQNKSKKKEEDNLKSKKNDSKKNSSEKKNNLKINFIKNGQSGLFNLYKKSKIISERERILSAGNSNSPNISSKSNLINFKKYKPLYNLYKNSSLLNSNITSYIKNNKNSSLKISYSKSNINQSKTNLEKKNYKKIKTKSFSSYYNRNNIDRVVSSNLILTYLNCINSHNSRSRSIKNKRKKIMKDSLEIKSASNIFSVRSYHQNSNANKSVITKCFSNNFKKKDNKTKTKRKIKVNKSLDTLLNKIYFLENNNNNHKDNILNNPDKKSVNLNVNVNLNNINININTGVSLNKNKNHSYIKKKQSKNNEKSKIINKKMENLLNKIKELNPRRINDILYSNKNKFNNDLYHFEHLTPSGFTTTQQRNKKEIHYNHLTKKNSSKKKNSKKLERNVFSSREHSSNKCKSVFNSSK